MTADAFPALCRAAGLPAPVPEHRFAPPRRWRFDYAWPALMLAYEREGATWTGGRHTRGRGYRNDAEKYSVAAILGWCVVRATADMERDGSAFGLLLQAVDAQRQRLLPPID